MSIANDSDRDWELWGQTDPYFGVLSAPEYLNKNLKEDSLREFFRSGDEHVARIYKTIQDHIDPNFSPDSILDYGCGVGRLVIPFAHRAKTVLGVDVSPSMLKLARENCGKFGIDSACVIHVDELEGLQSNSFDLIHSVLVFQHIPVERGESIFNKLFSLLAEGGVGAIHLTYSDVRNPVRRGLAILHKRIGFLHGMLNLVRGQSFSRPMMQMNSYSMNRIFSFLQDSAVSRLHVELIADGYNRGAMLYFQKPLNSEI